MNSITICNVIFLDKSYVYDKVLRSLEEHSNGTIHNNCVYAWQMALSHLCYQLMSLTWIMLLSLEAETHKL